MILAMCMIIVRHYSICHVININDVLTLTNIILAASSLHDINYGHNNLLKQRYNKKQLLMLGYKLTPYQNPLMLRLLRFTTFTILLNNICSPDSSGNTPGKPKC